MKFKPGDELEYKFEAEGSPLRTVLGVSEELGEYWLAASGRPSRILGTDYVEGHYELRRSRFEVGKKYRNRYRGKVLYTAVSVHKDGQRAVAESFFHGTVYGGTLIDPANYVEVTE